MQAAERCRNVAAGIGAGNIDLEISANVARVISIVDCVESRVVAGHEVQTI